MKGRRKIAPNTKWRKIHFTKKKWFFFLYKNFLFSSFAALKRKRGKIMEKFFSSQKQSQCLYVEREKARKKFYESSVLFIDGVHFSFFLCFFPHFMIHLGFSFLFDEHSFCSHTTLCRKYTPLQYLFNSIYVANFTTIIKL
jgi:hypothetical protein